MRARGMNPSEVGTIETPRTIFVRRMVGGAVFGLAYGGAFVNGINSGVGYVSQNQDYSVGDTLYVGLVVYWVSIVLTGLLAGYVARSVTVGSLAATVSSALLVVAPRLLFFEDVPNDALLWSAFATALTGGAVAASLASRWKVEPNDIEMGRVFGVSWRHWLWLWLPFQYVVANAVWLGTPRFILLRSSILFAVTDMVGSVIGVCAVVYAGYRALGKLRVDAPVTRLQAAVQFLGWFLIVPILVNIWRLLF